MKRVFRFLLCAAVLSCSFSGLGVFADNAAAGPVNTEPAGSWTIDDYSEPWHTLFVGQQGLYWVDVQELCEALGGTVSASDTSAAISIYGDEINLSALSTEALINGESYQLDQVARFDNGGVFLEIDDISWLFYLSPTEAGDDAKSFYGFGSDTPVYFFSPDYINTAPTTDQLTVLQGFSAPINTYNMLDADADTADLSQYITDSYTYLNGNTGVCRYGNLDAIKELLARDWNITDQSSLLTQLDFLFDRGLRADFQAAVSAGTLPDWFTAKWGDAADTSLLGWDLGQAVQLAQWGYCAGYLDPVSALSYELAAADTLQASFADWPAYGQDFLMGFDFMLGRDAAADPRAAPLADVVAGIYADDLYNSCAFDTPLPAASTVGGDSSSSSDAAQPGPLPDDALTPLTAQEMTAVLVFVLILTGIGLAVGILIVTVQNRRARRLRQNAARNPWEL